jgi:membrane-bound hydrogenase subunit beta
MTEHQTIEMKAGHVTLQSFHTFIETLIKEYDYTRILTITTLDNGETFELIYHIDVQGKVIPVRTNVTKENPVIPTVTDLVPGALLFEREVSELFGIKFDGHPDPQHLLLPNEWPDGLYPLRKGLTIEKIREAVD